jgi:hypothetical protein
MFSLINLVMTNGLYKKILIPPLARFKFFNEKDKYIITLLRIPYLHYFSTQV